jgi:3-phosphoshikimate 1-carboxyvinyltransferase
MRVRVTPGSRVGGRAAVPGDKSIAHRWLLVASVAEGTSRLGGLPSSLDVRSTASCLSGLNLGGPALEAWAPTRAAAGERDGSTWNREGWSVPWIEVEGEGREAMRAPEGPLDCGNSGTTMRLLAGLVASAPFPTILVGDASLRRRPMERVARPLREMGADVTTGDEGGPPLRIRGGTLRPIAFRPDVPSAQAKGAVLLAATAADGTTAVHELLPTRDHTERLLTALGATVRASDRTVTLEGPFRPGLFSGTVPGDPSSAAFLAVAAAVTGTSLEVDGVGLNPSRLGWVEVASRMGVEVTSTVGSSEVGEPVGLLSVGPPAALQGVRVGPDELPLVIDEVPVLAVAAAFADGGSRFEGGAELRLKESDRLTTLVGGLRDLGADAAVEGDDLVVGGGGLPGGVASAAGDHRIAMALVVAALAATGPSEIDGVDVAEVSFPGFVPILRSLGAGIEEVA